MNYTDFLFNLNQMMSEYYQACLKLGVDADSTMKSPYLAELAGQIATKFEDEADHYRGQAAHWRGEN